VYPYLNDLADEGLLDVTELAKRKIYDISDPERLSNAVEPTVNRLVTFSFVLKALLSDYQARQLESQGSETGE
jgi:hypothetical protein